ncbi:MAG: phosphoserine phosphatase SerB [Pseudomonadota bacterium]
MESVLVLICNPATRVLSDAIVERVREAVGGGDVRWLDARLACEFAAPADAEAKARPALEGAPVDIALVPAEDRRKKLLVADMDSTIIEQECIDELADFAGLRVEISAVTERAMRGELDFETALTERVGKLAGLDEATLQTCFDTRITLTPGGRAATARMSADDATSALVSGGFTFFTERVAAAVGFHRQQANILEIEAGRLTGKVVPPILGREAKRAALLAYAEELAINTRETIAVGDGANDLAMLEAAGLGVAFRAKPAVAEAADVRIDHGDLTALLYLQGYFGVAA